MHIILKRNYSNSLNYSSTIFLRTFPPFSSFLLQCPTLNSLFIFFPKFQSLHPPLSLCPPPLHLPLCPPFLSLRPLSRTIPLRSLAPSLPCSLRIYSMFLSFLFILPSSTLKIMDFYMVHNLLYAYCIYNITTNLYFIFSITTSLLKYSM